MRRFRLNPSLGVVVGNGKDLKITEIRCNDVIGDENENEDETSCKCE